MTYSPLPPQLPPSPSNWSQAFYRWLNLFLNAAYTNNGDLLPNASNVYTIGSPTLQFTNVYATNFDGTATSALYADVAEYYLSNTKQDVGTVMCIGGTNEIKISRKEGSTEVFGVVSTNPAFKMNTKIEDENNALPIALLGRVPCKVIGRVKKGQRLMASPLDGIACAWDSEKYSILSIIGRSLVNKETTKLELIEIIVGKN